MTQANRRRRGVILTKAGKEKLQAAIRQEEAASQVRLTQEELRDRTGLDTGTIAKVRNATQKVDLRTIEQFFKAFDLTLEACDYDEPRGEQVSNAGDIAARDQNRVNLEESVDVTIFYDRAAELQQLEQWILGDRCRLIALLGMGGIGKTSLTAKLSQQIQGEFQYVVWRSLRESPPLDEALVKLIQFLSDQQVTKGDLPESVGGQINKLLEYLRLSRCLVILDNAESIFQEGQAGVYRAGYEGYGELLRRVGEASHQSCVVLTSREKPSEVAALEGETLPVRSLYLRGLGSTGGQEILKAKGLASAEVALQGNELIDRCSGNPLLLKLIATYIREGFEGDVAEFLQQNPTIAIGQVRDLLDQQFARLSELEKAVMYWLAINREPTTIQELQDDIIPVVLKPRLIEALNVLKSRSLVETAKAKYTQQSVIMEYMTGRIVENAIAEIESRQLLVFEQFALSKATAKDYVRETQHRLILQPISDYLLAVFRDRNQIATEIQRLLQVCRAKAQSKTGYVAGNAISLATHLQINLIGWDFSNSAIWQADLKNVVLDQANFTEANFSKTNFTETLGTVFALALSPDGRYLATGDSQNTLCLWETNRYQRIAKSSEGHYNFFNSVCFSPNGQIVASGGDTCEVKLWSTETGQLIKVLQGHTRELRSVTFSPDGLILASASSDSTIRLWNVETGACIGILEGHPHSVCKVTFSLDGTMLASGSADNTVRLWDMASRECFRVLNRQIQANFDMAVSFTPDGKHLAVSDDTCSIRFWDVQTGECLQVFSGHTAPVRIVKVTLDGRTLISGSEDTTVKVWCILSGQCLRTLQGHETFVRELDVNLDRRIIVSSDDSQTLRIWNIDTGDCVNTIQGYSQATRTIAFHHNSEILASGSDNRIVKLWATKTGQCIRTLQPHSCRVFTIAFHPNGSTLVTRDHDEVIRLYEMETSTITKILVSDASQWMIGSICFTPHDHQILISTVSNSSMNREIRIWNLTTNQLVTTLKGHKRRARITAFNSKGTRIISGSRDTTLKLWDTSTGECLKTFRGHADTVWAVAFSSDEQLIASGSQDKSVKLWDAATGENLITFYGHTDWVRSVAFSPTHSYLASGSFDRTVRIWDTQTGACLQILRGHENWIWSISFSPDGRTLCSSDQDGVIIFWNMQTFERDRTITIPRPYEGMRITGATGLSEAQRASLVNLGAID